MGINIQTGGHCVSADDRRKKVKEAGGGVVDLTQMAPDERAAFIAKQEAELETEKHLGECCKASDRKHLDELQAVLKVEEGLQTPAGFTVPARIKTDGKQFLPKYQTAGAACADLVANIPGGPDNQHVLTIPPRGEAIIDCGFSIELPEGWQAIVSLRSSWAKTGLVIKNAPAIIDSDYRGRVQLSVANVTKGRVITVNHGERVAQMQPMPVHVFDFLEVSELSETERGEGGFGSTGK